MNMLQSTCRNIAGFDNVHTVRSGKLNSTAFSIETGDLCVYSPVAGLTKAGITSISDLGAVSALLAPNHYHNKGLQSHVDIFPDAILVCSDAARPRLQKQTGLDFKSLDVLRATLPENMQLLQPAGLKTGEVWLQVKQGDQIAWVVTDAFSGQALPEGEFNKVPSMLGTFPKFGIKDAGVYRGWLVNQISELPPTLLLPCHGSPVHHDDLGAALVELLDATV